MFVAVCHCDFCQKRTGSVFQVGAYDKDQHIEISGETKSYNGLEVDGVALWVADRRPTTSARRVARPSTGKGRAS